MKHISLHRQGFSLIELLLVIAIILVLGASSSVFYSRFLTQNAVANIADQIAAQLRKAQMYSMMGKASTNWGVRLSSLQLTLFAVGNSAYDESLPVAPTITIAGLSEVTFAKATGIPSTPLAVTISGNSDTKNVTLNDQGMVGR